MMIKNLITFSIIAATFCGETAFAQKTLVGSKDMPLELNLILENVQSGKPENFEKLLPTVMNIDLYARSMSKEDIFLIGKIEIYKTLLKNYDAPIKKPVDGNSLTTLRSALTKNNDNFIKWFLQALIKDCQELQANPLYKEFLLLKNNNTKMEKLEYRKLEKKSELLQFWISKISPDAQDFPDTLKNDLYPKMMEALKNIENSYYLLNKESILAPMPSALKNESELKFFSVKDLNPKPKAPLEPAQKSVEEILSPLTDALTQDLPMPSQENWLEDENTPVELRNLPKPSNDADWLEDF